MGKIVGFLSDGKGRVTSCVCAVSCVIALRNGLRVAVVQMPGGRNDISEAFDRHISKEAGSEIRKKTGLFALLLTLRGGRPDEGKVRSCALKTMCPGLDVFHAYGMESAEGSEGDLMKLMLTEISKAYDLVLVDGDDKIIPLWDMRVRLLTQSRKAWKEHFKDAGKKENCIYAINGYLKHSVANKRLFSLLYGKKLFTLGMDPGFMDAMAEGNVTEFIKNLRNFGLLLSDRSFLKEAEAIAGEILKGGGFEI